MEKCWQFLQYGQFNCKTSVYILRYHQKSSNALVLLHVAGPRVQHAL